MDGIGTEYKDNKKPRHKKIIDYIQTDRDTHPHQLCAMENNLNTLH